MNRLRVLIADDHEGVRWMVTQLLSQEFEIAGAVADGKQLIDSAIASRPDVIVSDISMLLVTGPEAMRELRANGLDIPFVLISVSSIGAEEYIRTGAMAFVDKMEIGYELALAVRAASVGQVYFSRSVHSSLLGSCCGRLGELALA
jgi:DNA-binding NarL/FixJ family response regulator